MTQWSRIATFGGALGLALACWLIAAAGTGASMAPTQPPQPRSGPGGSDYEHRDWRVHHGGEGYDSWYAFEPTGPRPERAPLAIVMHGYYEFAGYDQLHELIRHTVRQGSIVIYPRWQTDVAVPCPGPYYIEPCMDSAAAGIRGAMSFLRSRPSWTQPKRRLTSYLGFSFGGIITANLANRWRSLGLPKPRAVFLEDPHDGGLAGFGEPALDDSMAGIPRSAKLQCHSSANGVIGGPGKADSSCNALFPMLGHIPNRNKDLVMIEGDDHGAPPLTAGHGVCAAFPGTADAYDWNFCWKVWDALRDFANYGTHRRYALGDTRRHRSNGRWSDGTPIAPLKVRNRAPIRP
ncbi:MAG TPA: hypothetical protein VFH44_05525 [Solirubrobacterales bacterium]|nr:hypothetical protein [Solirubrobacterales bacterium]